MKKDSEMSSSKVSERMRKVKSKNTSIECAMRELLKAVNLEYEEQPNLPGKPDFLINGSKIILFCDSSFWHGRYEKDVSGQSFQKNRDFWVQKLLYNKRRDKRNNLLLRKNGWSVQRFWDTDILTNKDKVIKRLERLKCQMLK